MEVLTQSCGDVLTKKKLDPHRGQCRGASFTCLDCMTHFRGTDYKAHTVRLFIMIWLQLDLHIVVQGLLIRYWDSSIINVSPIVLHLRSAKVSGSVIQGKAVKSKKICHNLRICTPRSPKGIRRRCARPRSQQRNRRHRCASTSTQSTLSTTCERFRLPRHRRNTQCISNLTGRSQRANADG